MSAALVISLAMSSGCGSGRAAIIESALVFILWPRNGMKQGVPPRSGGPPVFSLFLQSITLPARTPKVSPQCHRESSIDPIGRNPPLRPITTLESIRGARSSTKASAPDPVAWPRIDFPGRSAVQTLGACFDALAVPSRAEFAQAIHGRTIDVRAPAGKARFTWCIEPVRGTSCSARLTPPQASKSE